ncbi:MAG: hypothetical protein OEW59_05140 [Gammaproteobacteria bacterium]|nr:hypothetical protein [Gammaproteobacteria bacterium]
MNKLIIISLLVTFSGGCATTGEDGAKRSRMRDCPPGMVQICESREHKPSRGGEEDIPEYEYCRCESIYR